MSRVPVYRHAAYRIWRCKRLLVLVPVIVMMAALCAGWLGGLSSYYFELEEVLMAGGIALVGTAIAVAALPGAPLEVLFGGVAAAILVATEPWQGLMFQPAHKGGDFTPLWLRAIIFVGAWMVLHSFIYAFAAEVAKRLPVRSKPLTYRLFVPGGDAATLRSWFRLRTNSTSGPITYSDRGWDGYVSAALFIRAPHPEHFGISDIKVKFDVKDRSETPEVDTFSVRDETQEREVRYSYRDTGRGAWIEVEEHPGPPAPLVGLSLRLNEGGPDLLRARADYHMDRPSPAYLLKPQRSLLCLFARLTHVPGPKSQTPAE